MRSRGGLGNGSKAGHVLGGRRRIESAIVQSNLDLPAECADAELAKALLARHPEAALVAWRRFLPLVMRILGRKLSASDGAEDVAQEVFAYFFRNVHKLREPSALRAFVITLTNRTLWHEVRRRRRRAHINVDAEAQRLRAIGDRADPFSRQAFWHLRQLLTRLSERDRRVLLMCMVEHREAQEAADALGVSVPTVRRSLARARKRVATWSETDPFLREFAVRGPRPIARLRSSAAAPQRAAELVEPA